MKPCGCVECPGVKGGGDKRGKWKNGDRVLVQMAGGDGLPHVYRMATLLYQIPKASDQWAFREDGVSYPEYDGGNDYAFCVERWLHVPNVLDRLAEI